MIEASLAFLFGLLIGSFLNVCIYRWPRDLSVVRPRSHCPRCQAMIAWYDNVPLVSYVLLGGRCRHCKQIISVRYPIVELMTAALFFNFIYAQGVTAVGIKNCVMSALLVGLMFSDLEERILPDELTKGGIVLGLIFAIFTPVPDNIAQTVLWLMGAQLKGIAASLVEAVFGAAIPAFFLWAGGALYEKVRHKEGLGFGDVKLIAMMGAFLGLRGALTVLIMGSVAGSLLGYLYIKITRKNASTYELPFGSFLCAAGIAAILFEKQIMGT